MNGKNGMLEAGTKFERYVNEDLKKAIEEGTASDYYYFTEASDGKYKMHAKLPEYGCGGPGKPIFKIRENSNRITKGFAQKFFNKNGQLDFEAGLRFTEEFRFRFGMKADSQSLEDPLASRNSAFQDAVDWLANEFDVPREERRDFSNFCHASFDMYENPAFYDSNFTDIWSQWALNGLAAETQFKEGGLFYNRKNASDEVNAAYQKYMDAKEEIYDLVRIDPATTKKMFTVTECSGSTTANKRFLEMARQARIENGETVPKPEVKQFSISIKEIEDNIYQAEVKTKNELEALLKEPPTEPDKIEEYNRKLSQLSDAAVDAKEKADHLRENGERKRDFHYAPVIGEFTYNDEKFYLTTEAFAAETDSFMDHMAMTDVLGIGFYRNQDEFVKFYNTDDNYVHGNPETQKIVDAKNASKASVQEKCNRIAESIDAKKGYILNEMATEVSDAVTKMIRNEYCENGWEGRYKDHLDHPEKAYAPTMGIDLEGITDDYDIAYRKEIRDGLMNLDRVEPKYQKQFNDLLGVVEELQSEAEMLGRAELRNDTAFDHIKGRVPQTESQKNMYKDQLDKLDQFNREVLEPKVIDTALARNEAMILLGAVLHGGEDLDNQSESRREAKRHLERRLKAKGYTLEEMQNMARDINGKLLPPTEVRMDVQAGMARFANEFAEIKTLDASTPLSPQAKEFATHNFDTAFNTVFTKEKQDKLAERGQTMFDHIYINGTSVSDLYEDKYKDCTFAEKQDSMKMEVMNKILAGNGHTIEAALEDQNGVVDRYPLNVTTNLPNLTNAVARTTVTSKYPMENYEDKINARFAHLSEPKNWKLSGTLTGVVDDKAFETMKIYNNFSDGMSQEEKLKQGAAIIQAVTKKNVLDQNGAINSRTLETLMSNVCVNGVPMRNLIRGEINKDTEKQAVDLMAGYLAKQMDEKSDSKETVSVISNGKHVPLTYQPPKVLEVTTKAGLFSSRETKAAHEREVLANEAGLKRQEIWNEKNKRAAEACQKFGKQDKQPAKERMSFAEFSGDRATRTRIIDKEFQTTRTLERSNSAEKSGM